MRFSKRRGANRLERLRMLTFLLIGAIPLAIILSRKSRRRRTATARTTTTRTTTINVNPRSQAQIEANARKQAINSLRRSQAQDDIVHLKQQHSDLLKLYAAAENAYKRASTEQKQASAFQRMMSIDNRMRTNQRQLEKAYVNTKY